MRNLGKYYNDIELNQKLMKKYYLMAIEHNNTTALNALNQTKKRKFE